MNLDNPAISAQLAMPPALLEEFIQNPKAFRAHHLKMLAVHADVVHMKLKDPSVGIAQRIQFMEFLAKISDILPKAAQAANASAGPGLTVKIVFKEPPTAAPLPMVEVVENATAIEASTPDSEQDDSE